jgi:hypothetical protein
MWVRTVWLRVTSIASCCKNGNRLQVSYKWRVVSQKLSFLLEKVSMKIVNKITTLCLCSYLKNSSFLRCWSFGLWRRMDLWVRTDVSAKHYAGFCLSLRTLSPYSGVLTVGLVFCCGLGFVNNIRITLQENFEEHPSSVSSVRFRFICTISTDAKRPLVSYLYNRKLRTDEGIGEF